MRDIQLPLDLRNIISTTINLAAEKETEARRKGTQK